MKSTDKVENPKEYQLNIYYNKYLNGSYNMVFPQTKDPSLLLNCQIKDTNNHVIRVN